MNPVLSDALFTNALAQEVFDKERILDPQEPHGKVIEGSGLWICKQESCDGVHHYYVKA